jgi:hypothetical protein
VDIGPADAAGLDTNQDFFLGGFGLGDIPEVELQRRGVNQGSHDDKPPEE